MRLFHLSERKMELYTYLVDVYYFTDNKEKYSETIKIIKRQMRNIRILAYLLILKSYKKQINSQHLEGYF